MRLYLDTCCLNRPFDDQRQDRIRLEAEAVRLIIGLCQRGLHRWVTSEVVELEISKIADEARRSAVFDLQRLASERLQVGNETRLLAADYVRGGMGPMDALHLAVAREGKCDILLTTDDRLLKRVARAGQPVVRVENPAHWIYESLKS